MAKKLGRPPTPPKERFHKLWRPATNDCWEWVGAIHKSGYGVFGVDRKAVPAHRASYQLFVGDIPDGMCICHTCDNRKCVNPDHLWVGTQTENIEDRHTKGRNASKERNGNSKLCSLDAWLIRELPHINARDIAEWFGISRTQVYRIRNGEYWV